MIIKAITNSSIVQDPLRMGERNDCCVVAFAHAFGETYKESYARFKTAGRRFRSGTPYRIIEPLLKNIGANPLANMRGLSLNHALWRLPKNGRFFVITTTHACAYVDGTLFDNLQYSKMRARVFAIYQFPEMQKQTVSQSQINELWERLNKLEGGR